MQALSEFMKQMLQRSKQEKYSTGPNNDRLVLPPGGIPGGEDADKDKIQMHPKVYQNMKPDGTEITNDKGEYDPDQTPFDIQKYLGKGEPGTLRNFLNRFIDNGPMRDQSGLGGGTATDRNLSPTPEAVQRGSDLAPVPAEPVPTPQPRPAAADYSMPTALDPQSIEELRQSLLTQAGQLDPNNPNGLAGRMSSPNAQPDMGMQRNEAMGIEDSIRGFDGGPKPHDMSSITSGAGPSDTSSALPDLQAFLQSAL